MHPCIWSSFCSELLKEAQFTVSDYAGAMGEGPRKSKLVSRLAPYKPGEPVVKTAEGTFTTSQFSGPLSYGAFKMESQQPGFNPGRPAVKVVGRGMVVPNAASPMPMVKGSAQGFGTSITNITSPASSLSRTQQVGAPTVAPPPGPSIADQVSPQDVGKGSPTGPPLPGAKKFTTGI